MIMVEAQEEVNNSGQIIKGKRTKRHRPLSPLALTMASCSSTSSASPTTSNEFAESTEEEEDMANCLILLARGHTTKSVDPEPVSSMMMTSSGTINKGTGLFVYQCKTCNRCFPSFQALGGHRASHKKPKAAANSEEKNKRFFFMEEVRHNDHLSNAASGTTLSLQISNNRGLVSNINGHNKTKLHECAICGAEFTSGQALGGHMRRHRTFIHTAATTTTTTMSVGTSSAESTQESKKAAARNLNLQLDLNLPAAPEDDRRETKFPFASKEQVIVFSASPLVDCHY
ncbi:hypothetical protein FNV43_RR15709 [Rhamnella rubrinervis]|uniref:C2H2-type domain-containing protein n=1 Tax=Rhamnella rubrinervis TaxID=2594499 RepID=A0A8K0E9E3_9ROSA|nr:hypothetical protein FNV43_RR15709 [Rhamnella rubrinervis]